MTLKTENTPAVPEAREDLEGIPADVAARLTPEDIELVKEVSKILDSLREEDPEREAWWDKAIMRACQEENM